MKHVRSAGALAIFLGTATGMSQTPEYECLVIDAFITTYDLRETYVLDINENNVAVGLTTIQHTLPGGSLSITYSGFHWTEVAGKAPYGGSSVTGINNLDELVTRAEVHDIQTGQTTFLPPPPPPFYSDPNPSGINDSTVVVGSIKTCNCSNSNGMFQKPYLWDPVLGARDIPVPGAKSAVRVNNAGLAVGLIRYATGIPDAYVYDVSTGSFTVLGDLLPPPTASTIWMTASDISDHGVVTGERRTDDGVTYRGYTWSPSQGFVFLPEAGPGYAPDVWPHGINSGSVAVGRIEQTNGDDRAFVWDGARGTRDLNLITANIPAGFVLRWANKINDRGWIVGHGQGGGGFSKGFVLKPIDSCYPDCNADGALTVSDFGCFQTAFVAGDPYADCNGDGVRTVADFGCFQTAFVAGCP